MGGFELLLKTGTIYERIQTIQPAKNAQERHCRLRDDAL